MNNNETVAGLVRGILAENAWDRTPVLADALEESGCDDIELLEALRAYDESLRGPWFERLASGFISFKDVKEAKEWLTNHAAHFSDYYYDDNYTRVERDSPSFQWMVGVCDEYVKTGEDMCLGFNTPPEAHSDAEEMWKHYETLTGVKVPKEKYGGEEYAPVPFRCAC